MDLLVCEEDGTFDVGAGSVEAETGIVGVGPGVVEIDG